MGFSVLKLEKGGAIDPSTLSSPTLLSSERREFWFAIVWLENLSLRLEPRFIVLDLRFC
jgi:hypothetical protein